MTDVKNDSTMHIGELAARTGLSLRSLRHWDEVGLVRASGRTEGGFRLYTADDEQRVLLIMRMKPLGFTLEEMGELARALDASPTDPLAGMPPERAAYYRTETRERRAKLERQLAAADDFLRRIEPQQPQSMSTSASATSSPTAPATTSAPSCRKSPRT